MWMHIVIFIGLGGVFLGGILGKIPYKKYMSQGEFRRLLLVVLLGNLIGMGVTWQNNQDRFLQEEAYVLRPEYGQGNKRQQFQINTPQEETMVAIDIPEQPGEEGVVEEGEDTMNREESFLEEVRAAASALNEEKGDERRYYLPSQVNGQKISWAYPVDRGGNMLVSLAILAAIVIFVGKEREKERQRQLQQEQMLLDYPNLVTKLCLLMQAGMTVRRAFSKTALDYKRGKNLGQPQRYAYEEMLVTHYEMESGVSQAQAYESFGQRCQQEQYRTLGTLLAQNLRRGGKGLLDILERESQSAFADRKRRARIQGEAAATKLLIPMVLMLLVVLIILLVPACMSFYG